MKRRRLAFDPWGLLLFGLVMVPNLIWFAVPAPNDILRGPSATPVLDAAASVCQVLFAAALCFPLNRRAGPLRPTPLLLGAACCLLLYAIGWICYYLGSAGSPIILLLTVPPCLAFLFFALDRRNLAAAVPISVFTLCHVLHGLFNFIL